MFRITSLHQRFVLFLLLPVALLLLGMGFAVFIYTRDTLLTEWGESTIRRLQIAAHQVDMRLDRPKNMLALFHQSADETSPTLIQDFVIDRLKKLPGVIDVKLTWTDQSPVVTGSRNGTRGMGRGTKGMGPGRGMRFHQSRAISVTMPRYDDIVEHQTVSLISELVDDNDKPVGRIDVSMRFDYLIENIILSSFWKNQNVFLVDDTGRILVTTAGAERRRFGDETRPIEARTLEALREKQSGTLFGQGYPPATVSGFFRLAEAPWTLVVLAPGHDVLADFIRFRFYYFAVVLVFILFILVVIRLVTWRTVTRIRKVSRAADELARGRFSASLPEKSHDEVGELVKSFNSMMGQLEERMRMKEALNLAMEVQQNLLPKKSPVVPGLDIAGKSVYCEETGGDYFDFLDRGNHQDGKLVVVVGDVSGHGIPSALLMATARALLHQRAALEGSGSEIIGDVNRQLCRDIEDSGQFMTLFYGEIDPGHMDFTWVTAGHDPAIVYDPAADSFIDLPGKGLALGVHEEFVYEEFHQAIRPGFIFLIGTDGIWETKNQRSEMFGKEALRRIVRANHHETSQQIVNAVIDSVHQFRGPLADEDDITLVVVKLKDR